MSEEVEYRCFIGGLAWATDDRSLKDAFKKFGHLIEAKVAQDKFSGRSRGFGFVSFEEKDDMEDAIKAMDGVDLDGRTITVEKAQPNPSSGRDRDNDRPREQSDRDRGYGGGGRGSGGGDCFKCGKPGHFARECPSEGGRDGGRDDRYGGGGGSRYGPDRNGDRYGDRNGDRDGDRNGDRYGGRSRDSGGGGDRDRYSRDRDRSGPYERRSSGGCR